MPVIESAPDAKAKAAKLAADRAFNDMAAKLDALSTAQLQVPVNPADVEAARAAYDHAVLVYNAAFAAAQPKPEPNPTKLRIAAEHGFAHELNAQLNAFPNTSRTQRLSRLVRMVNQPGARQDPQNAAVFAEIVEAAQDVVQEWEVAQALSPITEAA